MSYSIDDTGHETLDAGCMSGVKQSILKPLLCKRRETGTLSAQDGSCPALED